MVLARCRKVHFRCACGGVFLVTPVDAGRVRLCCFCGGVVSPNGRFWKVNTAAKSRGGGFY